MANASSDGNADRQKKSGFELFFSRQHVDASGADASDDEKGVIEDLFFIASSDSNDSDDDVPVVGLKETSGSSHVISGGTCSYEVNDDNNSESLNQAAASVEPQTVTSRRTFSSSDGSLNVIILEQKQRGIAHQLWPAAEFLCRFFESCFQQQPVDTPQASNHDSLVNSNSCSDSVGGAAPAITTSSSIAAAYNGVVDLATAQQMVRALLLTPRLQVIELGAGVGLCGIYLSSLLQQYHHKEASHSHVQHKIVLTDLPEAMDGLRANIEVNSLSGIVEAQVLSWGCNDECSAVLQSLSDDTASLLQPPLIIAADCVYWECLFEPLASTMNQLVAAGCTVLMAHVRRWKKDGKFFAMCRKRGWVVRTLLEDVSSVPDEATGEPRRHITRLYHIHRN